MQFIIPDYWHDFLMFWQEWRAIQHSQVRKNGDYTEIGIEKDLMKQLGICGAKLNMSHPFCQRTYVQVVIAMKQSLGISHLHQSKVTNYRGNCNINPDHREAGTSYWLQVIKECNLKHSMDPKRQKMCANSSRTIVLSLHSFSSNLKFNCSTRFFIRNLAQGLVLKVP